MDSDSDDTWSDMARKAARSKQAARSQRSLLFDYTFLLPLLFAFLNDKAVLRSLPSTCREMYDRIKQSNYLYKQRFDARSMNMYRQMLPHSLFKPASITRLTRAKPKDLQRCPMLKEVELEREAWMAVDLTPGMFPDGITHFTFDISFSTFNRMRRDYVMKRLVRDVIPSTVTHLRFSDNFNQLLEEGLLPQGLLHLTFGNDFNSIIKVGALPDSLTYLEFGRNFNQPFGDALPPNLTQLDLSSCYSCPIAGVIPSSVTAMDLGFKIKDMASLPPHLTKLLIGCPVTRIIGNIPAVTFLELGSDKTLLPPGKIPSSVKTLILNQPLGVGSIPDSVETLNIAGEDGVIAVGAIPVSVTTIAFSWSWNHPIISGTFPDSLTDLFFSYGFNQPLSPGILPRSLQKLSLGESFNRDIAPGVLPNTLKVLRFGSKFNQPLSRKWLPPALEVLAVADEFDHLIDPSHLPPTVTDLTLGASTEYPMELLPVIPPHIKRFGLVYDECYDWEWIPDTVTELYFTRGR